MSVPVVCPKCGKEWEIAETVLGNTIQCPRCPAKFQATEASRDENIVSEAGMEQPLPRRRPEPRGERERFRYDDDYDPRIRRSEGEEAVSTLIPYRNGKALASYYCGVFGIIPVFGLVLGPIALILGFLGIRYANQYPEAKGKAHAIVGIILGLFATIVNGGIFILIMVGIFAALTH